MLLLLPDRNLAIRSVTVCVCDGVPGQHISVSVFTLAHSFTSLLSVPLFCFWLAERLGADRLIEDRLKHGQTPIAVNPGFAPFPCKHKPRTLKNLKSRHGGQQILVLNQPWLATLRLKQLLISATIHVLM